MKLTAKTRKALPGKDFAVKGRKYPIENKSHARNALARVSEFGSSEQKKEVREKVARKYPGMEKKQPSHITHHTSKTA